MRKLLLASAMLLFALPFTPAKADIILCCGTPAQSFVDDGGLGFGHDPRLLTLQTTGTESGNVTPVDVVHGDAIAGANKSTTPTLGSLGWNSGSQVKIGFDADQTGQSGITISALSLTIFNGTVPVATFSLAAPVVFSAADLGLETGNGNGLFNFTLTAAEQTQFNSVVAQSGSAGFFAGLGATLTGANDGPDTFLAIPGAGAAVPGPVVGAGIPGLIAGCIGLIGLARRRRRVA